MDNHGKPLRSCSQDGTPRVLLPKRNKKEREDILPFYKASNAGRLMECSSVWNMGES